MSFDLAETRLQLSLTPGILRAWLLELPESVLGADEGPETFSARDVLAHLIHGERTDWMGRARRILEEGESRPFEPFDRFAFLEEARGWSMAALLDEFQRLRAANLAALEDLRVGPEDLAKRGTHPALGPVTLGQLLTTWVVHDLGHLGQIARVLARRNRSGVGPWIDYLPILTRK